MAYTVLARKWRPTGFEDFVGQEAVAKTLKNAIETGRVAHAYLFAGERGTGKTSMVRVFAKALNCEKGPTGQPCNQCPLCRDIQEGRDMDVLEIDGASYRKVEEISEILKNVGYRPARARYKIYIIDEVHMLSEHAFNALLKTLEEPPPHVKFIFATTEPEELLDTIKSRCQRFDFRKISTEAIAKRLRHICDAEKIEADDRALLAIAKNARGGMRDALTILDQIVSFSTGKIIAESVNTVLGLPTEERVSQLMDAVISKDFSSCLKSLDALINEGKDPLDVLAQLVDYARDLMVLKAGGPSGASMGVQIEGIKSAAAQAQRLSIEHLVYMIQIFSEARKRARERAQGRVAAEVALIKAAQFGEVGDIQALLQRLEEMDARMGAAPRVAQPAGAYRASTQPAPSPTANTDVQTPPAPQPSNEAPPVEAEPPEAAAPQPPAPPKVAPDVPLTTEVARGAWPDVVLKVKLAKARIGLWLSRAEFEKVEGTRLTVALPPNMVSFEREQLENQEHRQLIEACASEVLGRPVSVAYVTGRNSANNSKPEEVPQEAPSPPPRHDDAYSDPVVKKTLELFDGRVLNIEEK